MGSVQQGCGILGEVIEIFRKLADLKGEATTLNNLGLVYADWGHYAEAVEYYEKSLDIKTKLGDSRAEGATLNNLGNVYHVWGQPSKALENYEKSLEAVAKPHKHLFNVTMTQASWKKATNILI
ncbi:MAG: tetratricopeptide repeat protein [Desulfomonilaceae bacterium]